VGAWLVYAAPGSAQTQATKGNGFPSGTGAAHGQKGTPVGTGTVVGQKKPLPGPAPVPVPFTVPGAKVFVPVTGAPVGTVPGKATGRMPSTTVPKVVVKPSVTPTPAGRLVPQPAPFNRALVQPTALINPPFFPNITLVPPPTFFLPGFGPTFAFAPAFYPSYLTQAQLQALNRQAFFNYYNRMQWNPQPYTPFGLPFDPSYLTQAQVQALNQQALLTYYNRMLWNPSPFPWLYGFFPYP
jgi:hypothetical protein